MKEDTRFHRSLTRRELLKRTLHALVGVSVPASCVFTGCKTERPSEKPRNVILISIDTLRADHLGCYGYTRRTSPTLDRLASQGVIFSDTSSPSPWTLPAHASLLTGKYPSRHALKTHNSYLPADIFPLAHILRENGFHTAAIVNSFYLTRKYGLDRGFNDFVYVRERLNQREPSETEQKALEWLSGNGEQPFFLFLHCYDPHSDYCSLQAYEEEFVRSSYQGTADGTTSQLLEYREGLVRLNQEDLKHLINLYDASIRQMDDGMARLLKFLETEQLLGNTLLIVTSDHGEEFLDHGGVLHGRTQFQELIHVPLIFRGPGVPRSVKIKQIGSLTDILPTVLRILDIPCPGNIDGVDLGFLWQKDAGRSSERYIFSEADHNNVKDDIKRAVRTERYKLHYDLLTQSTQLFDLTRDPREETDIASQKPVLVRSLLGHLQAFMQKERTQQSQPSLTPMERERLKSLGYLQ
jgi:arylsulfatase A-like enzyme